MVAEIMKRKFWEGMTKEMLLDSLGRPADIDREFDRGNTAETFKYNQDGKNRFRTRIILRNDVVTGWKVR